jgi:hypothetical protein
MSAYARLTGPVALGLALAVALPVAAADPAPAPSREAIERTIQQQTARRSGAISGFVIGGIVILGGIVKSAVDTVDESDRKLEQGDTSDTPYDWTGTAVGLALGAPIIIVSALTFADAQKQLRHAKRRRLSLAPVAGGAVVALRIEFGAAGS